MNFGGYPAVILEDEIKEKRMIIDEIYHSYLEKDISYFLRIEKIEAFSELIRIISSQIGKIINFSEICSSLNISIQTLKNYLWYAEKTFILKKITPLTIFLLLSIFLFTIQKVYYGFNEM